MIAKCIPNPIFLLAFDLDLNDKGLHCTTTTKEFIQRLLNQVVFDKEENEFDVITEDIVLAALFTVISFIEKRRLQEQKVFMDEDRYKEFKSFYKTLAVAETKITFSSELMNSVLFILSSINSKIEKMIDISIEGTNKKILDVQYVNSKTEVKEAKINLYLVMQITTE